MDYFPQVSSNSLYPTVTGPGRKLLGLRSGVTASQVQAELRRFGARRYFEIEATINPYRFRDFGVNLMMAIASRESAMMQLLNPERTDKGIFQITNKFHNAWLASVPGCPAAKFSDSTTWKGSWIASPGKTAADDGYVPTLKDAARFAYQLLKGKNDYARNTLKISNPTTLVRFTIAAYNGGAGGAAAGWREGDVDKYTTGGDYSKDVLDRWRLITEEVKRLGWH